MGNVHSVIQVESGGSAFEYLDEALVGQPELHARFLAGHAASLARLALSWSSSGHEEAAEDDRKQALALYERAAGLSGDWRHSYQQGLLRIHLGDFQGAGEVLKRTLAGIGDDEVLDQRAYRQMILVSLGYAVDKLGETEEALALYQQAAGLRSQTTVQQARINESVALIKLGRFEKAEAACREVIQRGSSRYEFANSLYNLACVMARTGRRDEALRFLWAAVTLKSSLRKSAYRDKDFDSLQGDPEFGELIRS